MENPIVIKPVEKTISSGTAIYLIGEKEVSREIYSMGVNPLRVLLYLFNKKNIKYQVKTQLDNVNSTIEITIDQKDAELTKLMLEEILEYRFSKEAADNSKEIIRQLPFKLLMQTSDNIMNFGKSEADHARDMQNSRAQWAIYNPMIEKAFLGDQNPNKTKDSIQIPKKELVLRKHAIYTSARGGYNIKTLGYSDSSLDHYCFMDSRRWD